VAVRDVEPIVVAALEAQGLETDDLTRDDDLFAAGLTSLGMIQLLISLEDECGVVVPTERLRRDLFRSIGTLIECFADLADAQRR
jgi:acyl carrier protein